MTTKKDKESAKNKGAATDTNSNSTTSNLNSKNLATPSSPSSSTATSPATSSCQETVATNSTGKETKRTNKPLMEKRRRARINQSLAILKALILESTKANSNKTGDVHQPKHTKLEKADILELTVRHFQKHRHIDNEATDKYKAGYSDCAREVARYLSMPEPPPLPSVPNLSDSGCKTRLLRHLDQCIAGIDTEICPRVNPIVSAPNSLTKASTSKSTAIDKNGQSIVVNSSGPTSSNIKPNEFSDQNGMKSPSVPLNQDENNNGQRIIVQQSQVNAHSLPASNGDSLLDQESNPEPMSGIKQTTGIITPKIEASSYYPAPIAAPPHAIKDIKPADMTQLLEYGEIKLIDASSTPFRVPPHYVQLVASPSTHDTIDTNSQLNTNNSSHTPIKTEMTLLKPQTTTTDYENLIEMNARKPSIDSADIAAVTATANKLIKFEQFESKIIANTSVVSSNSGNMVISSISASPFSSVKAQTNSIKVKNLNGVQQMDVDETSTISPNPNHLPSPKIFGTMDNTKLINKVKIVVDNMNGGIGLMNKHRLDLESSNYHLMAHPHASLMAAAAAAQQVGYPGSQYFHSSFHLYEYNQNNQNFLNQHRIDGEHPNAIDDSMWRPW